MLQLILHLFGDYVTQSDWMALNKRKNSAAAAAHALVYSVPFAFLTVHLRHHLLALEIIGLSHYLIDRFGLARYLVWLKNGDWYICAQKQTLGEAIAEARERGEIGSTIGPGDTCPVRRVLPGRWTWKERSATGYDPARPAWLAVWLLIACDNTLHLAINYAVLRWL